MDLIVVLIVVCIVKIKFVIVYLESVCMGVNLDIKCLIVLYVRWLYFCVYCLCCEFFLVGLIVMINENFNRFLILCWLGLDVCNICIKFIKDIEYNLVFVYDIFNVFVKILKC